MKPAYNRLFLAKTCRGAQKPIPKPSTNPRSMLMLSYLTSIVLLAAALPGMALPKAEFNKTIKKEFPVTPNGTTYLDNKYGKIEVKTWDQNRVKITVTIKVKAGSESAANDVFDRIGINFSSGEGYVKAETHIEPATKGWLWSWIGNTSSDYSINYEVLLPASNNLDIGHRYGDLFVAAMKGRVKLDVKYVNFKIEAMGDNSSLLFGYGNGTISRAGNLNAEISYSKLLVEEAADIQISSKYTQVNIGKAKDLNTTTKYDTYVINQIEALKNSGAYDNFKINSAASVDFNSKYAGLKAEKISRYLHCNLSYGNVEVKMSEGFSKVNCTGSYGNAKIGLPEGTPFAVDAATNYAGISYPDNLDIDYLVEKNTSTTLQGKTGKAAEALIYLRLNYGGAKIYYF